MKSRDENRILTMLQALGPMHFFFIFFNKFIYFWLHCVFVAVRGLLIVLASVVAEHGL